MPMIEGEQLNRILLNHLGSPVSGILSLAQLVLLEGGDNPDLRDYAQSIYDRGQRMLATMENLVDLERIERGSFDLHREPVVLNSMVDQLLRDYDRVIRLKELEPDLRIQGLPWNSAPLLTFWTKENLLWGIVDNAFRNALEAAPSGAYVGFHTDLYGDSLVLSVENDGEVPLTVREQFFDPFRTTKPDGVGLGTFMIQTFSEALDGGAEMTTGHGRTKLRISLPQREGDWNA